MTQNKPKAKVFISCGQQDRRDDSERPSELETATKISATLAKLGFEPYMALLQQNLKDIKGKIFAELKDSDYFIFVDFRRETISGRDCCRGSLFSHQELALASMLELEAIVLQEEGVEPQAGIMKYVQANPIRFCDRPLLCDTVAAEVQKRRWNPAARKCLRLGRPNPAQREATYREGRDAMGNGFSMSATFFHVYVKNLHDRRQAYNCYAYPREVASLSDQRGVPLETFESKWAAYMLPNALIGPMQTRRFDAFHVYNGQPKQIRFETPFCDWAGVYPAISGPGEFLLTYEVISENFAPTQQTFRLKIGQSLDEIEFEEYSESPC